MLKSVVILNSVNSTNLYQVIRKYYSLNPASKSFEISVDQLKDEMGLYHIENGEKVYKYPKYSFFFIRDVINKSIKEIIEKTEIKTIKFTVVGKKGRMVHMLKFEYSLNEDTSISDEDTKFLEKFDKVISYKQKG